MLNNNAVQKLLTSNPGINLSANKIMLALITNKKRPNVTIVMGNVRMIKTGFTIAFNSPKTAATIIAVVKSITWTPGKKFASTKTTIAESKIRKSMFIFFKFLILYYSVNSLMEWKFN